MNRKIVLIAHRGLFDNPRGGEKSSLSIMEYLKDSGYDCTIIMTTRTQDYEIPKSSKGIKFIIITNLEAKHYIAKIVMEINPDVVLCWGKSVGVSNYIRNLCGIPYIVFVRTWQEVITINLFTKFLKEAARVIVNCYEGKRRLENMGITSVVSYCPIDDINIKGRFTGNKNARKERVLVVNKEPMTDIIEEIAMLTPEISYIVVNKNNPPRVTKKSNILYFKYCDMIDIWASCSLQIMPLGDFGQTMALGTSRTAIEAGLRGIPTIVENGVGMEEVVLPTMTIRAGALAEEWARKIREFFAHDRKFLTFLSKTVREKILSIYNKDHELLKIKNCIEKIVKKQTGLTALAYISDGIGNLVEAFHSVQALKAIGYKVDILVKPSNKLSIEFVKASFPYDNVYKYSEGLEIDVGKYSKLVSMHRVFRPFGHLKFSNSKFSFTALERDWNLNTIRDMGYSGSAPKIYLNSRHTSPDIPDDALVVCPGVVSKKWAFKGYNNYKNLNKYFNNVVYVGSNSDILPELPESATGSKYNFIGKLSLLETISIVRKSACFLSHDGGLSHIAANLGIPTFIIFGPTTEVKNLPLNGIALRKKSNTCTMPCQYTGKFMKCKTVSCMKDFTLAEVVLEMHKVLYSVGLDRIFKFSLEIV